MIFDPNSFLLGAAISTVICVVFHISSIHHLNDEWKKTCEEINTGWHNTCNQIITKAYGGEATP